jgi:carbamoyl-phosphate synthase large subunit
VVKTAKRSSIPCRVLGTDRHLLSPGLKWVDRGFVIPHCSETGAYLREMQAICAAENVQLILPCSESELELLSNNAEALRSQTGAVVVASSPKVLGVALNKWETCRFLEGAGLNFPRYARLDAADEVERLLADCGFPLVAKPCRGTGSRGLCKVTSARDFDSLRASAVEMVLEEYLHPDEQDYGVKVYTLKNGRQVGTICYHRKHMVGGDTIKAQVVHNEAIESQARAIVSALGASGPCNLQLRLTNRGPVIYEINPRCTGMTAVAAHFGYDEVEMAIRDLVLDAPVPTPTVRSGFALRFWEEIYLDDEEVGLSKIP